MKKLVKPAFIALAILLSCYLAINLNAQNGQREDFFSIGIVSSEVLLGEQTNDAITRGIKAGYKLDITPMQVDGKIKFLIVMQPK